ncbi:hypothetical protein BDZ97DRAFT_1667489 [Flammula alnicola]|nr:hypothetical protein BDZ97DRAFT_1667489 [Flammula alnicola]
MQLLFTHPLLTTSSAHLISLFLGSIYVGSLYLSQKARLTFGHPEGGARGTRDDPAVIRARLLAVSGATLVCGAGVFGVLWAHVGGTVRNLDIALEATLLRLGFPLPSSFTLSELILGRNVYAHLVTPILFLGPLFGSSFLGKELPGQRNWTWRSHIVQRFFSIQGVRNYWVAPITEEIVFRACVLSIYHLSGASRMRMIFLGPLTFGLAHVHHGYETFHRYGRNAAAAKRALITSLFQLAYTTLFGSHASYLFLRTGSILPPITAHIFCNVMGIPEIAWEMQRFPKRRKAIIAAYITGIIGFVYTLGRWTKTTDNFYWPEVGEEAFKFARY